MGAVAERTAVNRAQLEHVIRASAAISGDDEIIVIGSQAIIPRDDPDATSVASQRT